MIRAVFNERIPSRAGRMAEVQLPVTPEATATPAKPTPSTRNAQGDHLDDRPSPCSIFNPRPIQKSAEMQRKYEALTHFALTSIRQIMGRPMRAAAAVQRSACRALLVSARTFIDRSRYSPAYSPLLVARESLFS
jgi:hypothetical protein